MEGMEFNSDTLCDEFQKGCQEAGHQVRKVSLRNRRKTAAYHGERTTVKAELLPFLGEGECQLLH